ncbi:MAG: hypothetical protein EOO69_12830 [Moraxellaceae bacterium]|nr:MAG: hypothetical protein EOO69_12830 [Moraxellaceae bacterium]
MKFHIGLDFGTYQSKVCVYSLEGKTHEFFRFSNTGTFFLPSRVGCREDETFEYGPLSDNLCLKEYHYFKIASAEDEEFHVETFERGKGRQHHLYREEEFAPFTAEFLSVLYLTNLLFTVKDHYLRSREKKDTRSGFLKKLFTTASSSEHSFTIQLGIPTEWSQLKNLRRKRKFENILMICELLQKHYRTHLDFLKATSSELKGVVGDIYSTIELQNAAQLELKLHELGISVFPETAAGLTFIVKSKQLQTGYYAIMDIGGGTTDISFFSVEPGNNIKYLASESYIIAANNVYKKIANNPYSIKAVHEAEQGLKVLIQSGAEIKDEWVRKALVEVRDALNKLVYKLFNRRVYFFKKGMIDGYNGQPILLYGGGSRLPSFNEGSVLIHDNGSPLSITIPVTYMEKQKIEDYTSNLALLPMDQSWKKDFPVLVVALGLSFVKPDSFADWFGEEDYHWKDVPKPGSKRGSSKWGEESDTTRSVQHPQNEDYYLFNVLASRWNRSL